MKAPLVSAIIPIYNASRFLEEAVHSVFAQTYTNWELLLVDDGSTDSSADIARRMAEVHPDRIRYLEHEGHRNRGASASRNLGARHARGTYIAFMDADDIWLPEKLERQVPIMEATPEASMLYCSTEYWYSWTGRPTDKEKDWIWDQFGVPLDTVVQPPGLLTTFLKDGATVPCTGSLLIRREAFERVGGYEESFTHIHTDQAFYAKFCLREPVMVTGGCWDKYRQHPDSSYQRVIRHGQAAAATCAYLTWVEKHLLQRGVENDSELWKALQAALRPYRPTTGDRIRMTRRALRDKTVAGVKAVVRRSLPAGPQRWLRRRWYGPSYVPPVGQINFGDLRRVTPISRDWGFGRGMPVDRYYIESFLRRNAADIRGRALEVADATYTRKFGGERVTQMDVIDVDTNNPAATIIADLNRADHIPADSFDCIILTQTLLLVYDFHAAVRTLHRVLRPGGVLLVTLPNITQIARHESQDYWRFTDMSAQRLFSEVFPAENVQVTAHGNVLAATAFLHGVSARELTKEELDHCDPDYQITITVRAVKGFAHADPANSPEELRSPR